jgi:predicted TPR repeat methyltransferase
MGANKKAPRTARFDRPYYERHYYNQRTAVNTRADMQRLARLIAGYVDYLELPIKRILDAGCGCGWLRAPLLRLFADANYSGLECSEYLCKRYGWKQGSIADFKSRSRFELIVCNGVLQYMDDRDAVRALSKLGRLSSGVLYFNALTSEDWRKTADRKFTDGAVYLRSARWYRTRLRRSFIEIGAGLWLRCGVGIQLWHLERTER